MVISSRTDNIASLPLKVYRRLDDDVREAASDHGLAATFSAPNPEDTTHTFIRDLTTDLDIFDCTYWRKVRVGGQLLLVRMFPDAIAMRGGPEFSPEVFREQHKDGTYTEYPRADVLWLHGYGGRRGISPMETLKTFIQGDEDEGEGRRSMARNAWRSTGVISRPADAPQWSADGRSNFIDQMNTRYSGGANAGKPLLLEEGMTWQADAVTLRSSEYIAARELTIKVVAMAFHMSPQMIGLEDAPYASITEYNRQLYTNVLSPRLHFIEQGFGQQLVSEFPNSDDVYCEFALEAKLRGSFLEQAQIASTALGGKAWMTVEEWRSKMNLPPLTPGEMDELNPAPVAPSPGPDPDVDPGMPAPSDDTLPKASPRPVERRGVAKRRDDVARVFEGVVVRTLARQRTSLEKSQKSVLSSRDRWDRELAADLRPVMEFTVVAEGMRKATQLGGTYDSSLHQHYLDAAAAGAATGINDGVDAALSEHASDLGHAFDVVLPAMAALSGLGAANSMFTFAREEAGKQNGAEKKVWVVNSAKSRHPELRGMEAPLGGTFANGLQGPGEPNCQCSIDIVAGKGRT